LAAAAFNNIATADWSTFFYDATTKRFHNLLLVRAQIAQAPAHAMNFTAAHGLKTLW
jgi:hypothetical protein